MDSTHHIINAHNPNKDGKHPHAIQKMGRFRHIHSTVQEDSSEYPNLVPLKDWKPADVELFASMGFSSEKSGDDGFFMEEDNLTKGNLEPNKFIRRISRTKTNRWILEKKDNNSANSTYRVEKVFDKLMGVPNNPGLLDYFDTLTNELTEQQYLYTNMKLKSILENMAPPQQDVKQVSQHAVAETPIVQRGLSKEQKKTLQELVYEYNKYNEVLEARKKMMDVANKMHNIGELTEAYLLEKLHEGNKDENAWFEEKTIRRNTNEIKKMTTEFKKSATEIEEKMRHMQSLYQECGMMLERYFHME